MNAEIGRTPVRGEQLAELAVGEAARRPRTDALLSNQSQ